MDIKLGDVAIWLNTDKVTHSLPERILFIESSTVKLGKPRKPLVDGLGQCEVTIIDTSKEAKSRDDTRFLSDAAFRDENKAKGKQRGNVASPNYKGVGRGHILFYADSAGDIKGIAFSFDRAKFHGLDDWSIVVGRPKVITANLSSPRLAPRRRGPPNTCGRVTAEPSSGKAMPFLATIAG